MRFPHEYPIEASCRAHPPLVGTGNRGRGAVPRRGRCVHRQRRDPVDPRRPACRCRRDPGCRRGLPDRLRRAGDHRRPAGRHRRPQARVHHRRIGFTWPRCGAGCRDRRRDADLRPRRAGRCRGDDGAAGARLHPHAVPRRARAHAPSPSSASRSAWAARSASCSAAGW